MRMAIASAASCCTFPAQQSKSRNLHLLPKFNPHESVLFPPSAKPIFPRNNPGLTEKWRNGVSFFRSFLLRNRAKDREALKKELLDAIAPLDRGADASPDDKDRIDQIAREIEAVNPVKNPLKSELLNGKWELIYTTSNSILQNERPKFLRSSRNYQAINVDTLRAQNMESWPFFNQWYVHRPLKLHIDQGDTPRWIGQSQIS